MSDVQSSGAVPRVPSTSVHLSVPAYVVGQVEDWSKTHGLTRAESIELLLLGALHGPGSPPARLRDAYETGAIQKPGEVSDALDKAGIDVPVIGFLLGPRQPLRDIDEPFERDHIGADLTDDPLTAWSSTRGVWRVSDRPRIVVALRLGLPLAIYRVSGWEPAPGSTRRWAPGGTVISGPRRIDANTGEDLGDTSETERTIASVIMAKPITQPSSANPLVWLHRR